MTREIVHLISESPPMPHHQPQVTKGKGVEFWSLCEPTSVFTGLSRYCCLLCMKATLSKEKTRKNLWKIKEERKISFLSE